MPPAVHGRAAAPETQRHWTPPARDVRRNENAPGSPGRARPASTIFGLAAPFRRTLSRGAAIAPPRFGAGSTPTARRLRPIARAIDPDASRDHERVAGRPGPVVLWGARMSTSRCTARRPSRLTCACTSTPPRRRRRRRPRRRHRRRLGPRREQNGRRVARGGGEHPARARRVQRLQIVRHGAFSHGKRAPETQARPVARQASCGPVRAFDHGRRVVRRPRQARRTGRPARGWGVSASTRRRSTGRRDGPPLLTG